MATIGEINAGYQYQGNAALGGGNDGVIAVDTKPLDNLAYYTMQYHKAEWEQKQKDQDAKVAELSSLANIRLNDLRGKDKEQATKEFAGLVDQYTSFAKESPKTAEGKVQLQLKIQTAKRAFMDNYDSGKARAISYETQLNDINSKITDPKAKELAIKDLDKKFDSTDIATPISSMDNYKIEKIDIPKPVTTKVQAVKVGGNENFVTDGSIYNPKVNSSLADAVVLGIKKAYPQKGTPDYENLSDKEKSQADYQATVDSQGKVYSDMATVLNSVLLSKGEDGKAKYIADDGSFNHQKFEDDNFSNSTLMTAYKAAFNLDDQSRTNYKQALDPNGVFTDKGVQFKLRTPINPDDFKYGFIDFTKGVTPSQMVQAGIYAQHAGDTFETKVTETDNAIQTKENADKTALGWAKLKLDKDEFGLKQKQFEASQTGSQTQVNGAMETAKRIYADMLKLADANGVISPDKVRQLNTEQLKYLGIEVPQERDKDGTITNSGGFKPLDLSGGKEYAIQLGNGDIKVLAPKDGQDKLERIEGGKYVGQFDNTRSTNIFNVATNRLNEELKTAGTKELNSYWGVDVTGNATNFTDNQSSSTKSTSESTNLSTDPADWKQEGKNWRYKDGSLYDSKGVKIK